jgi:hypothetical protein
MRTRGPGPREPHRQAPVRRSPQPHRCRLCAPGSARQHGQERQQAGRRSGGPTGTGY